MSKLLGFLGRNFLMAKIGLPKEAWDIAELSNSFFLIGMKDIHANSDIYQKISGNDVAIGYIYGYIKAALMRSIPNSENIHTKIMHFTIEQLFSFNSDPELCAENIRDRFVSSRINGVENEKLNYGWTLGQNAHNGSPSEHSFFLHEILSGRA